LPRAKATPDRVVATILGSGEPRVRETPRSVRDESVGRERQREPLALTAAMLAQTLRELARSRRPIETDGLVVQASEWPPREAVAAGQTLLA
jgi:hypothetical protein